MQGAVWGLKEGYLTQPGGVKGGFLEKEANPDRQVGMRRQEGDG